MRTRTSHMRNSMNRCPMRLVFLLIPLVLAAWFALAPTTRAVCQDGCLANFSTVQGDNALLNNTGSSNTAVVFAALFSNTFGGFNTALGSGALESNVSGFDNAATGDGALFT